MEQQELLTLEVVEVVEDFQVDVGGVRRFRYRYRKRIKQGQWIVATESTI
jgi:hypothetical protein